jgi:hypothetical protein
MLVVEFITYASPDISGLPMIFIALALAFALAGAMVVTTVLGHSEMMPPIAKLKVPCRRREETKDNIIPRLGRWGSYLGSATRR